MLSPKVCTIFLAGEYTGMYSKGGVPMKIVVVKSPRLLSGIFRVIFKIRKEESVEAQ